MNSNGKNSRFLSGTGWMLAILILGLATSGWGGVSNRSTITIEDTEANVGDTVEVPLTLDVLYDPPSTLVLFLEYDPAKLAPNEVYYENIIMNPLYPDQPLLDEHGVALSAPSAVRMSPNNIGKSVETAIHPEGVIAIAIQGGIDPLNFLDDYLLTVAFDIIDGDENELLALNGVDDDDTVEILNEDSIWEEVYSSGATTGAEDVEVIMVDGTIQLGCLAPLAPAVVTASTGQTNGIQVSWSLVAGDNIQYRVYRSLFIANPDAAVPLGNGWLPAGTNTYLDLTALPFNQGGLTCLPQQGNVYYYWVKSRSITACESPFSSVAAEGRRGKAMELAPKAASALPSHAGEILAILLVLGLFVALGRRHRVRS